MTLRKSYSLLNFPSKNSAGEEWERKISRDWAVKFNSNTERSPRWVQQTRQPHRHELWPITCRKSGCTDNYLHSPVMSVEIHAGVRICGQTFGSAQVRGAFQVFHFSVKWDRFLQPFHTFTVDHDLVQATKNCWRSGWARCCVRPSALEVSSISLIRVWVEIFSSHCYLLFLATQRSLLSFAQGLVMYKKKKWNFSHKKG